MGRIPLLEHALSCPKGGFPSLRHNEIRDITTNLLTEVFNSVCIEPHLQPAAGEHLNGASSNIQDGARLDIAANGLWGSRSEGIYFHAPSNRQSNASASYKKHEKEKKRAYEQRIREIEHSFFYPPCHGFHWWPQTSRLIDLQMSGNPLGSQVEPNIQHNPELAKMPPVFLPPVFLHPGHTWCSLIMWQGYQS